MSQNITAERTTFDYDGTFDAAYANLMESTDEAAVSYDVTPLDDDITKVAIRRTVIRKARNRKDQVMLWMEDVAILNRDAARMLMVDFVQTMTVAS